VDEAVTAYDRAIELSANRTEREFLTDRRARLLTRGR
jgi:predicted RNA polymerase sigma factor